MDCEYFHPFHVDIQAMMSNITHKLILGHYIFSMFAQIILFSFDKLQLFHRLYILMTATFLDFGFYLHHHYYCSPLNLLFLQLIQCIDSISIFTFQNMISNKYFWAKQTYWLIPLRKQIPF